MTPQEQEHLDHVAGSATEHQNCFAQSQIEHAQEESNTQCNISKLTDLGLHVVVEETIAHCKVTDAIVGVHTYILGAFLCRKAADSFLLLYLDKYGYDGESNYQVYPLETAAEEAESHGIDMDDDCPF